MHARRLGGKIMPKFVHENQERDDEQEIDPRPRILHESLNAIHVQIAELPRPPLELNPETMSLLRDGARPVPRS